MTAFGTTPESTFEHQVVKHLISGHNQWVNRPDLKDATEDQLWHNFYEKLNRNNWRVLKGEKLTPKEFNQVKRQIESVNSPYQAAKLLEGENGIGKVSVTREDAKLGTVNLGIFWKADVAGGKSSYEVVEQPRRKASGRLDNKNRRFDVTLLINGLPLIQLELKKSTVELNQAFDQVQKYADEGMYNGIFSLVQMFVIMTPDSSAYFANCKPGHFNPSFVFDWRNNHNQKVENGLDFTDQVLNIPMAHEMVSEYTVIDEERKQLILLRPYQIYAIQAIMHRIHEHKNGFVWNTMGSGKTLTSYKTAKLAVQDNSVDRALFVVDRKALDEQTTANFKAYAANDDMSIKDAENTGDLIRKMNHDDGKLLITSIQKLYRAVQDQQKKVKQGTHNRFSKLFNKRIVFFVDEIQRSQFGNMQRVIRKAFPNGDWYGYTGTPIFKQNAKKVGDQWMTTESLFGKVCHPIYTIRTALDDKAVLPFNVEHISTITQDTGAHEDLFRKHVRESMKENLIHKGKPITTHTDRKILDKVSDMSMAELEDKYIPNSAYAKQQHIDQVVDYIMKYGPQKTSLGKGNFNAILTTSSIPMALRYYDTFKRVKANPKLMAKYANYHQAKHDAWNRHWPQIAVTYSIQADNDPKDSLHKKTLQVLKDYNNQYFDGHQTFGLDNLDEYNDDVAKRTARRDANYANLSPKHQINLCIVVQRLLTGFDAPRMNTLFVDRILQLQQLIQAYSRTNRLQDRDYKQEGQIVTFRKPHLMEHNEKEAYLLYAGEGSFDIVMRPDYQRAADRFENTVHSLKQVAPTADSVDKLAGTADKVKFVKLFRKMIRQLNSLAMYHQFSWHNSKHKFGIAQNEMQHYVGKYNLIKEQVQQERQSGHGHSELDDLDFSLSIGSTILVDYDYITRLINAYVDKYQQYMKQPKSYIQAHMSDFINMQADITHKINQYASSGHHQKAKLLSHEFQYVREYLNTARDKHEDISETTATTLMFDYKNHQYTKKVNDFAKKWGLNADYLDRVARAHRHNNPVYPHEVLLRKSIDVKHSQVKMPPLFYKMNAQKAWRKFINDDLDIYLN